VAERWQRQQNGAGGGSGAAAWDAGLQCWQSSGGSAAVAGQCSGSVGNARAAKAAQQRHWMRRWQLGGGGSRAAGQRQRQHSNSGGRAATAVAVRQRRWQCTKARWHWQQCSGGGISAAEARRWQAVRQRHLQRGVSGSSMVVALTEWQRQHGRGTEMAGSRRQ
jgi:hypothetical protein